MKGFKIFYRRFKVEPGRLSSKSDLYSPFTWDRFRAAKRKWTDATYPVICNSGWHFFTDNLPGWVVQYGGFTGEAGMALGNTTETIEVWVIETSGRVASTMRDDLAPKHAAERIRLLKRVGQFRKGTPIESIVEKLQKEQNSWREETPPSWYAKDEEAFRKELNEALKEKEDKDL